MIQKFYLKVNDSVGYIDALWHPDAVDTTLSQNEALQLLSHEERVTLNRLMDSNYLTEEAEAYLLSLGWVENSERFRSNGDVHAWFFEKEESHGC